MIALEKERKKEETLLFYTKTQIPGPPRGEVSRKELTDGILKSEEEVIVFQAGAGFGKTTVMAELARRQQGSSVWYRLNESDNKLIYFLRGFCSGFGRALTERIPIPEESGQKEEDIVIAYHRILSAFLLEIREEIFYICLDDFQVISNERIYQFFGSLIEYGQGKIRLLLTVKGAFPKFLSVFLMQGRVLIVSTDQLRFGKRETGLLLKGIAGGTPSEKVIRSIQNSTEGWAAGVVFAGLALKDGQDKTHLNDYIFYEIYRKLSYEIQTFLTETSVIAEPDAEICNYALERSDSVSMFEYLVRENLFLLRREETEGGYRYHFLFSEFLKERLEPVRKEKIFYRAAVYYARRGDWKKSADYALKCGGRGYEIVSAIIEKFLFAQEQEDFLESCLTCLYGEKERLTESTLFCMYRLCGRLRQKQKGTELLLIAAEKAFKSGHYETYTEYMCFLIEETKDCRGMAFAKEQAEQAWKRLSDTKSADGMKLILCRVECCLELENFAELVRFLNISADRRLTWMYCLYELRRIVSWAVRIGGPDERDFAEEIHRLPQEARLAGRTSKIFAEYGFCRAVWRLYEKEDPGWMKIAEEGVQLGGGSIFHDRMRLILLLEAHRRKDAGAAETEELVRIEAHRERRGLSFPALREEDAELFELLFHAAERKAETEDKALSVKCLGQLEVTGRKGRIHFRTRKTKELFACLFFEEGRGVKKDTLMERLWPEQYGEKSSVLFHTTVSYLRKALTQAGAADVLITENQSYRLDISRIWSDIERLMCWYRRSQTGDWPPQEETLEAAELYHECYLYGEDYTWIGSHREYVEEIFLQTAEKLAVFLIGQKQHGKAALMLEKAVQVNGYAVSHRELLVECLLLKGDVKGAKRQYERMCTVCREELLIEPALRFEEFRKRAEK